MKVCRVLFFIFYPIFINIFMHTYICYKKKEKRKCQCTAGCIHALRHCLSTFPQFSVLGPSQFQTHFITMNFTLEWEVLLNGQDHSSVLHSSFPLPFPTATPALLLFYSIYSALVGDSFCILPIWLFYSAHCLDPAFSRTLLFVFIDGADWCLLEKTYLPLGRLCVVPECCPVWCASSLCFLFYTLKIEVKALLDTTRYMYTLPFSCWGTGQIEIFH